MDEPANHYDQAIDHMVSTLSPGEEPMFSGRRVLRGTKLVFACWESARRRGRVQMPIDIEGSPLKRIYESRQVGGMGTV